MLATTLLADSCLISSCIIYYLTNKQLTKGESKNDVHVLDTYMYTKRKLYICIVTETTIIYSMLTTVI